MRKWCIFRLRFVILLMAVRDADRHFVGLGPFFHRLLPHPVQGGFSNLLSPHGVNDRLFVDPNYGLLTFHDGRDAAGDALWTPFGYSPVGHSYGVLHHQPIRYASPRDFRPLNYWEKSSAYPWRAWRDPRKTGMSTISNDQAEFKVS
jgi:hypothetical protein